MRIGVDARCLEEEKISGVGEYALGLLHNLLEIDRENEYIFFSNSFRRRHNDRIELFRKYPNAKIKKFHFPNKILNFCFWYLNYPKIDKLIGRVDVFFAPNINFLAISRNCPLVITFHDLSFERYPHFFSLKTRLWHKYFVSPRKIARSAKKVIAVSESTKNDLEELYQIRHEKISTIHHGVSKDFREIDHNDPDLLAVQRKYKLPYKFILYLGNIEPRKNFLSLIYAYKNLLAHNPRLCKHKLVLAGRIDPAYREFFKKEKDIITCGYIKREDRSYVYNLSSLFVYPSFFEGFGLPVLEAMACKTPVISSNNSSLPEVVDDAAILIDPNRPTQIADAIEAAITDQKLYNKQREKCFKQAQKFNWKKCAEETLEVIQN